MVDSNNQFRLYSVSAAAKQLGLGKDTLYSLIACGRIRYKEIGKRKKIPYSELVRFQNEDLIAEVAPSPRNSVTGKEISKMFGLDGRDNTRSLNGNILLNKIMGNQNGHNKSKR